MSGIGFCIDCGHSRKATRPPCARNRALRVENNCVSRESAFCEKKWRISENGGKKYFHPRQEHIFPESEKKSGGNRLQHRDARSIKRYRPARKLHVRRNDHPRFRIFDVSFSEAPARRSRAGYRGLKRELRMGSMIFLDFPSLEGHFL